MARRRSKRQRHRRRLVFLALVASAALVGAYIWRALQPSRRPSITMEAPSRVQQPSAPNDSGEDFTAAERQGLQDALRGRGTGKQQHPGSESH